MYTFYYQKVIFKFLCVPQFCETLLLNDFPLITRNATFLKIVTTTTHDLDTFYSMTGSTLSHSTMTKHTLAFNLFTFTFLADAFIQSRLIRLIAIQAIQLFFYLSVCVPWESNPQPLYC